MSTIQSYFSEGGLPIPHFRRSLDSRKRRREYFAPRTVWRFSLPQSREPRSFSVAACGRSYEIMIASSRSDFEQAFQLLARRYQERGYEEPSANPYRFTPFHALPDTVTFVAKREGQVVATLSLVPDNPLLGLPMECIYGDQIAAKRQQGCKLAEVTSLAEEGLTPREFIIVFNGLIRLMMQTHLMSGGDTFVIAVNPRHTNYYARVVGFEPFGERRLYPSVQNAPAEALWATQELIAKNAPAMHMNVFGQALAESILTPMDRPCNHTRHFGARSTMADQRRFQELTKAVRQGEGKATWRTSEPTFTIPFANRLFERQGA